MPQKEYYRKSTPFWNRSLLIIINFILIFGLGFSIPASLVLAEENLMASVSPIELTTLINKERLNRGLPALEQSALLQRAAELKANDMKKSGYFSHTSPDGKSLEYWLHSSGYKYESAGENLMTDIFKSSEAATAWMNSPKHRENILKREYTQIGTAVVQGMYEGKETVFAVQFFGTPQAISPSTQIISKPLTVATPTPTVTKIKREPKTQVIYPKKVVKIEKKKIMPAEDYVVLLPETSITNQYPRLFYAYDNGIECVIV